VKRLFHRKTKFYGKKTSVALYSSAHTLCWFMVSVGGYAKVLGLGLGLGID